MALKETEVATLSQVTTELLARFNKAREPGMTIGVVQQDALVVQQSAGYADLEGGVALGPITRFRIASISKQFTCALILMMAAEGQLSIEDDIRRWLPELPKLEYQITLDHLMRNTSGIRDMLELMRLGGIDLDSSCTREDLMAAICRQSRLNFPPGAR
jgi:D-aminopeptidase